MSPPLRTTALNTPHFCTILTTPSYIPGLLGLLTSLYEVKPCASKMNHPLVCYVTEDSLGGLLWDYQYDLGEGVDCETCLLRDFVNEGSLIVINIFKLLSSLQSSSSSISSSAAATTTDSHFKKQLETTLKPTDFLDSTRRLLFLLNGRPFVYLDLDLLVVGEELDGLIDLVLPVSLWAGDDDNTAPNNNTGKSKQSKVREIDKIIELDGSTVGSKNVVLYSTGNFRNKKKLFSGCDGNFNAGIMICFPSPNTTLSPTSAMKTIHTSSLQILSNPNWNDTEEKLLNLLFAGVWKDAGIRFNLQKRCFNMNPKLWNDLTSNIDQPLQIVHYVGGKPWHTLTELEVVDWEFQAKKNGGVPSQEMYGRYERLFEFWKNVVKAGGGIRGELIVPCGVIVEKAEERGEKKKTKRI